MSKEYWGFENENGDTGFLAGVVDVLTDNLPCCDFGYTFDADIFPVYVSQSADNKNIEILGQVYLYMAFEYFFIAYDEWAVDSAIK